MINLNYQCEDEIVRLKINREQKEVLVCSVKTDYAWSKQPYKVLFDPGKEKYQEKLTDQLNDEDFIYAIDMSMQKIGYEKF